MTTKSVTTVALQKRWKKLSHIRYTVERKFQGQIIGVTGHTPYSKRKIENMVIAESGYLGDKDIWQQDQIMVIGKKGFDKEYLQKSIEIGLRCGFVCDYLTQEAFLLLRDYNYKPAYFRGDPRIWEHEGLSFLASIGFEWPSTYATPGNRTLSSDHVEHWRGEHPLVSKFGYNVRKGTSRSKRKTALMAAIKPPPTGLGLQTVAYHIAFLIKMGKRRYDSHMDNAVIKWEQDLGWLNETYYKGSAYSFIWPVLDA